VDPRARRIPFLVGPTAVGKTDVAVAIAEPAGATILSVDARQVYRGLDAATGKPDRADVRARHRLLDIWEPSEQGTAADFASRFWSAAEDVWTSGGRVLVTAGAGFYMDACLGRVDPMPPVDERVRRALRERWDAGERDALYEKLMAVDPETAGRVGARDAQRVLRALEVWEASGEPLSRWQRTGHGPLDTSGGPTVILLTRSMDDLSGRIARRCSAMVASGLEDEIRSLLEGGVPDSSPAFKTLGYTEWLPVVRGETGPAEALELFIRNTRQYARRQLTWFRNRYSGVRTLDVAPDEPAVETAARLEKLLPRRWGTPTGKTASRGRRGRS